MARTGKKIVVSDAVAQEVLRLSVEAGWSLKQIAAWIKQNHGHDVSYEWVRQLLLNMSGAGGVQLPPAEQKPEEMDDDQQLRHIQLAAFKDAITKSKRGDTQSFAAAAKAHVQAIEARRRLKEPQTQHSSVPSPPVMTQADRDALVRSLRAGN